MSDWLDDEREDEERRMEGDRWLGGNGLILEYFLCRPLESQQACEKSIVEMHLDEMMLHVH
jgi:hypothetical protein